MLTRTLVVVLCVLVCSCGDDDTGAADAGPTSDATASLDGSLPIDGSTNDGSAGDGAASDGSTMDDAGSPDATPFGDGLILVLSNFRVDTANQDRVYFDSNKAITGSTGSGFTVSNKTITGVSVTADSPTGHYFTVAEPFSYWDNNTIRYEGDGDVQSADSVELPEITLTYIVNGIPEPDAPTDRYVTTDADGSGDGTSEASAWTFQQGVDNAEAGMTIWMKAGDYGAVEVRMLASGTPDSPIKFVGYKTAIGDITTNYWDYTTDTFGDYRETWDTSEMPTLSGTGPGWAINLERVANVVIRNLQIRDYHDGIKSYFPNSNMVLERINGLDFRGDDNGASFILFTASEYVGNPGFKILGCVGINALQATITVFGDGGTLIDGCKTYCDRTDPGEETDYHISVNGHNNIVRNCHSENFNTENGTTSSHGIGIRGSIRWDNDYNLIERSTAINLVEALYIRNRGCDHNVVKDCYVGNNQSEGSFHTIDNTSGLTIIGNGTNNVFERCIVEEQWRGIYFVELRGDDESPTQGMPSNNLIRNCVFNRMHYAFEFFFFQDSPILEMNDNSFVNCTFNEADYFVNNYNVDAHNLDITNCNITNVDAFEDRWSGPPIEEAMSFEHNNFSGSWGTVAGAGNIAADPNYTDSASGDFSLAAGSASESAGMVTPLVLFDMDREYRGTTENDIGAYSY